MTGPPAARLRTQAAPPTKRANSDGIPVRLHDGTLVAHVNQDPADRLMGAGAAETCRRGPRRYLRLRQGITIPCMGRGWDIIEFLRRWHGDKRAAGYVAHKDRQSECLPFQAPSPGRLKSIPQLAQRHDTNVSEPAEPHDKGAK